MTLIDKNYIAELVEKAVKEEVEKVIDETIEEQVREFGERLRANTAEMSMKVVTRLVEKVAISGEDLHIKVPLGVASH